MKLYKSTKEKEVFYYFNAKGEKLWLYRHKYYDASGKRKEKKKSGFKMEKAAIKALLEVKAQTLRGETKYIENDNITVAQWADTWLEMNKKKWKKSTYDIRSGIVEKHIKKHLGNYKMQKLDRAIYQRVFISQLEREGYKTSTIKRYHSLFLIVINAAVEEEILPRNRFTKAVVQKQADVQERHEVKFLTPVELKHLIQVASAIGDETFYTVLLTLAYTGMRRGEALGLQWQNVDFENNTITVERTRDNYGIRTPKTKNSYRTILVDSLVMDQLKKYKTWCKQVHLKYGLKFSENAFVFINDSSNLMSARTLHCHFSRAMSEAGLIDENEKPKITTHGLRHTHATVLLNNGQNVKVIAERLGNTPDMIYKVYGHVLEELERQSVEIFSQSLQSGAKSGAN